MDLDAFFSEQDQRMNMPDDDFDEYLIRMGYKLSEEARRDPVTSTPVASNDSREPERFGPLALHIDSQAAGGDEIHAREISPSDQHVSIVHSPEAHRENQTESTAQALTSPHDPPSSISSGTLSLPNAVEKHDSSYLENENTLGVLKRKASQDSELSGAGVPQKKRNISPTPQQIMSPFSSIEEITSFGTSTSISPRGEKRPINLQEEQQEPQLRRSNNNPKSPKKRKVNALKLQPLAQVPMKVTTQDGPSTSPIEDACSPFAKHESAELRAATKLTSLKSGPSRLYLEVKERVAKHATSRRRDKVIKLATKDPATNIALSPDKSSVIYASSAPSSRSSSPVPAPSGPTEVISKRPFPLKPDKSNTKVTKSKKKAKPPPMTPVEYVRHLQERAARESEKPDIEKLNKRSPFKFLRGKSIFYIGGDMTYASERTRGRMDCIVKYGGNLLAAYDPAVTTHIVTDAQASSTLRALGLKRLNEIPNHIPTIKWDWIAKAIGRAPIMTKEGGLKVRMDEMFMHAAFRERIDAGSEPVFSSFKGKGKGEVIANEDISHISEFTQDKSRHQSISRSIHDSDGEDDESDEGGLGYSSTGAPPSPPTSPHRPIKSDRATPRTSSDVVGKGQPTPGDPLAEFYAKARAERDSGWSRHGEVEESDMGSDDETNEPASKAIAKRGWTCDAREVQRRTCVNQDIIDKLQELKDLHQSKPSDDDRWRVFSYSKCIRALRNHPKRIESFAEARTIRGVGEKTAAKIIEIIETGGLRRIGYERTDDVKATRLFQGIYGVGQSTAFKWYAAGCRTLDDILGKKGGVKLTPAQEIGIRFYDDINNRMPREEARTIFDLIKPIALEIDAKLFVEIMGSYRRGKADCGDIDILITRPTDDGKTHEGVLPRLLRNLHAAGVLTEDLAVPEDPNDLEAIYRGLCRVPKEGARRRRIDFLTVPWQSRGAALLYYTGDDIFNRAIRWKAGAMGYSLNQKGLFKGVVRDPRDRRVKMNTGTLVASETEEEIFRILNVPWQEPRERVRG